jgi:hypothetical protein
VRVSNACRTWGKRIKLEPQEASTTSCIAVAPAEIADLLDEGDFMTNSSGVKQGLETEAKDTARSS